MPFGWVPAKGLAFYTNLFRSKVCRIMREAWRLFCRNLFETAPPPTCSHHFTSNSETFSATFRGTWRELNFKEFLSSRIILFLRADYLKRNFQQKSTLIVSIFFWENSFQFSPSIFCTPDNSFIFTIEFDFACIEWICVKDFHNVEDIQ